jgi:putative transposase
MGWNETGVMDERRRFVLERLKGDVSMTELCASFGISRPTGYKWMERFSAVGFGGLFDLSSAPRVHGRQTAAAICEAIVGLRGERPNWGPKKIVAKLQARDPQVSWPAPSTAGAILKRAGLVANRRRRFRVPPRLGALSTPLYPNHVWAADHKGWVTMKDGTRLEPLTISDGFSRYLILLSAAPSKSSEEAMPLFLRAFDEHGLPDAIRTDNGVPFAAAGVSGLTPLSLLFARLGIEHERIDPGKPQQNGRHERFHATLSPEMRPPAENLAAQEKRFEVFRDDYNRERPHEALGQKPPASQYHASRRALPSRMPEPDYGAEAAVRKVRQNGAIKWGGQEIYISHLLQGEPIAVEEGENGFEVRFYNRRLGQIDPSAKKLCPIRPAKTKPENCKQPNASQM